MYTLSAGVQEPAVYMTQQYFSIDSTRMIEMINSMVKLIDHLEKVSMTDEVSARASQSRQLSE